MGNNDSSVETFLQWIKASDNIVFFGGAGVSTESGIPDFRSVDGLYNQKYDYPPETILSHTFYTSIYLVVECVTISAPHSNGRQLIGVANVLSTIKGTP